MKRNITDILKLLNADEPNYQDVMALLTDDDYADLNMMVKEGNHSTAEKAIYCLGLMRSAKSLEGISMAAKSGEPAFRVAAANALRYISYVSGARELLRGLLNDEETGVRKFTLMSIEYSNIRELKNEVAACIDKEHNKLMINLAKRVFARLNSMDHPIG